MSENRTLRIERTYQAPAQAVFDAWTSEEVMRRWWHAEHDWETTEAKVDLRVGGAVRVVMRDPHEDVEYGGGGVYTEIEPPTRLAFTWLWDDNATRQLIELDFEEADGATTVRFTHSGLWDEEAVRSHEGGWTPGLRQPRADARGLSRSAPRSRSGSSSPPGARAGDRSARRRGQAREAEAGHLAREPDAAEDELELELRHPGPRDAVGLPARPVRDLELEDAERLRPARLEGVAEIGRLAAQRGRRVRGRGGEREGQHRDEQDARDARDSQRTSSTTFPTARRPSMISSASLARSSGSRAPTIGRTWPEAISLSISRWISALRAGLEST